MAEPFAILIAEGAEADLRALSVYAQRLVLGGLEIHLRDTPAEGTRRIKLLRPNAVAGWELRLGDYRVLYDVDLASRVVFVQVVGKKVGNRLFVQGKEYTEHESHRPE